MWSATRRSRRVYTILYAVICVVFGGFWLVPLDIVYLMATTKPIRPFTFDFTTVVSVAVGVIGLSILLILPPLLIGTLGRCWPTDTRGRPYGLSAGSDGVLYYPRAGKRRLIRWEEMRLLEATARGSFPEERWTYRLYGQSAIAEWSDVRPSNWVSVGLPTWEFLERHQALLDMIAARTGLTPRTFDAVRQGRGNA
jgi:hypothetical protein